MSVNSEFNACMYKDTCKDLQQRIALKDLEIMRLREALNAMRDTFDVGGDVTSEENNALHKADKALSTPTTYDSWHNEQFGENCALLTIREQLEPKIDILFSGINKLPVGVYNLIPIKKGLVEVTDLWEEYHDDDTV